MTTPVPPAEDASSGGGRPAGKTSAILAGIAVGIAVVAIVVTALVVGRGQSPEPVASDASPTASPTVPSPSSSASPTTFATASPDVTASLGLLTPATCDGCIAYPTASSPVAGFDDGLLAADLPPLVARPGPSYPEAHQLTAAVWAKVGPTWGVATYWNNDWQSGGPNPAELYLVSPEGVHFHVMRLAEGLSYGAFVESVDLSARTAVISMNDEGGYWMDDVDLASGTILGERDFIEEGGGLDDAPYVLGPYVNGIEIRVTPSMTDHSLDDVQLWNPATGSTPIVLPSEGAWAGRYGFGSTQISRADQRYELWVSQTDSAALAAQGYADVMIFDVVENSFRPARALYPHGYTMCNPPGFLLNNTSVIDCERGTSTDADWAVEGFTVTFDGTTPPVASPILSSPYAFSLPWRTEGFEVQGDMYGVSSVTDVFGGARTVVYQNPWADEQEGGGIGTAVHVGDGLFIFYGRDAPTAEGGAWTAPTRVIGYNRHTGKAFNIVPGWFADTGAPSSLTAYVAFGD